MAKTIEPKLMKIGEYLKLEENAHFFIPEYQRAYSWCIDRCDKLWNDIIQYLKNQEKDTYFFGTVILSCQDNDEKLLLIDGQQRTTTFLLLLKAFLLHINRAILDTKNDEDSQNLHRKLCDRRKRIMSILYRLDTDDVDDLANEQNDKKFFESGTDLMINNSISEDHKGDFNKILRAIDFDEAEFYVDKIKRKQKDNKYSNFFKNFKFFYNKISELGESKLNEFSKTFIEKCEIISIKSWNVDQAIVMFNSLNSDGLPLNDADIILSKLYGAADDKKHFSDAWGVFKSYVRPLEEKSFTDIDAILTQYMYYLRTKQGDTKTEHGTADVTVPGLRRYFSEINKDAITHPDSFVKDLTKIAKTWNMIVDLPCVQVLSKFNDNAKTFLASFFYRFEDQVAESDIKGLVECLLKLFTVLEIEDTGYSSSKFKSFLFLEEIKFVDPKITMAEIKLDFKEHILKNWTKNDIKEKISEYEKNILVYLNEYLFAKEKNQDFNLDGKQDVEHIMPASGKNIQAIREDAELLDEEEFKNTVNSLGNKILLESSINRSVGNAWFRTKVSTTITEKTGYIDSKYALATAIVEKYKNDKKALWKKSDIDAATEKASARIVKFIFE